MTQKTPRDFIYHVFYGTSRNRVDAKDGGSASFGDNRDSQLHYGLAYVHIPKHHRVGSTGSLGGMIFGYDPYVSVQRVEEYKSSGEFFDDVKHRLKTDDSANKNVLIFIHGYNNTFDDSLIRVAQVGVDVGVEDYHSFMFSWASRGDPIEYTVDEATIDASEPFLEQFLTNAIKNIPNGYRVSIIAHSMGNRALLRVTSKTIQHVAQKENFKFWQIFLAAPDVDVDVFKQLAPAYMKVASNVTIYTSPADGAVHLSQALHYYPRVGYVKDERQLVKNDALKEFITTQRINLVDVKNQCVDKIGHAYFAEAVPLLEDIRELVSAGTPSRRKELGWDWNDYYWVLRSPKGCE